MGKGGYSRFGKPGSVESLSYGHKKEIQTLTNGSSYLRNEDPKAGHANLALKRRFPISYAGEPQLRGSLPVQNERTTLNEKDQKTHSRKTKFTRLKVMVWEAFSQIWKRISTTKTTWVRFSRRVEKRFRSVGEGRKAAVTEQRVGRLLEDRWRVP